MLYNTPLILTQFMYSMNMQTRQHIFSIGRINLHGISHASCQSVVELADHNPKLLIPLSNVNAEQISTNKKS